MVVIDVQRITVPSKFASAVSMSFGKEQSLQNNHHLTRHITVMNGSFAYNRELQKYILYLTLQGKSKLWSETIKSSGVHCRDGVAGVVTVTIRHVLRCRRDGVRGELRLWEAPAAAGRKSRTNHNFCSDFNIITTYLYQSDILKHGPGCSKRSLLGMKFTSNMKSSETKSWTVFFSPAFSYDTVR